MVRKSLRIATWLGAGLALIVVGAVAALAVALWSGPIDASFIAPRIEQALAPRDGAWRVRSDSTVIAWEGWSKGLRIQVTDVRADRKDGTEIVRFPKLSVALRLPALVSGEIAVKRIALHEPELRVERDAEGRFNLGLVRPKQTKDEVGEEFIEALANRNSLHGPVGSLETIEIVAGRLTIADPSLGREWRTRNLRAVLKRDAKGIQGRLSFDLAIEGETVHFAAEAVHSRASRSTELDLRFAGLDPALFASARGAMSALTWIKVPLSGRGTVEIDHQGRVRRAAIDFKGAAGVVDIPGVYNEPLPVRSVALKGDLDQDGSRLTISELTADLGETTVKANGVFRGSARDYSFAGNANFSGFPVARFARYWPDGIESSAKAWVTDNIEGGQIDKLRVEVELRNTESTQGFRIDALSGGFSFSGLDIRFYRHLPKVTQVAGDARFDDRQLRFDIAKGRIGEIEVGPTRVVVDGFDRPKQSLSVASRFAGPMAEILRTVDNRPLGFARQLGVNPLALKGRASGLLKVDFKLLKTLSINDVGISARADIAGLLWRKGLFGLDVEKGKFDLTVDKKGLSMKGDAMLGAEPAKIDWRERFGATDGPRRAFTIDSTFSPQTLAEAGLDIAGFMSGKFGARLDIKGYDDGRNVIEGAYDFDATRFRIPMLSIVKPEGMKARGRSKVVLRNQRVAAVPEFSLDAPVIKASGRAQFHADGETLKLLQIDRLRAGLTDAGMRIAGDARGTKTVTITGKAFDLKPLLDEGDKTAAAKPPPRVRIVAKLNRVYLAPDRHIDAVKGELIHTGGHWARIDLFGKVGNASDLSIRYARTKDKALSIRSADAGATLRVFNLMDGIRGGQLEVTGAASQAKPDDLAGDLTIRNFRVSNAPTLARILALASQEGLSNWASSDKGIEFSDFSARYRQVGDTLYLREGRAVGSQLGVTVAGAINTTTDRGKLVGTVVPLYALNSAVGKVPLLGRVIVGEKGGGLFAVRYTVEGDLKEPKVSANPLSMLTPGIFRRLFDLGNQAPRPKDEAPEAPSSSEMLRRQGADR